MLIVGPALQNRGGGLLTYPGASPLAEAVASWDAADYTPGVPYLRDRSGNGLHAYFGSSRTQTVVTKDVAGVECVALPGSVGYYASTPSQAHVRASTELDVRIALNPATWTPATAQALMSRWNVTGNLRSWQVQLTAGTGKLILYISGDGTASTNGQTSASVPTATGVADGTPLALRVTWRGSDGLTRFYWKSVTPTSAPSVIAASTGWTQFGGDQTTVGVGSLFTAGTAPVEVGTSSLGTSNVLSASVYAAQMSTRIDGPPVAVLDPTGRNGLNTWTSSAGNTWTLWPNGTDTNDPLALTSSGAPYVRLNGGEQVTTPNNAALVPTTQLDIRLAVAADVWRGGTNGHIFQRFGSCYSFYYSAAGAVQLYVSSNGSSWTGVASVGVPSLIDGALVALRVTWRSSDGRTQFFMKPTTEATAKSDCQANTGWTQFGTDQTLAAGITIYDTAGAVAVGAKEGRYYYADVRHTIDGAPAVSFDPSLCAKEALSWTSAEGLVWTLSRPVSGRKMVLTTRPVLLFGTDDYLEVSDHPLLNFGASDSFTLAIACRIFGAQSAYTRLMSKESGGASTVLYLYNSGRWPILAIADGTATRYSSVNNDHASDYSDGVACLISGVRDAVARTVRTGRGGSLTAAVADITTGPVTTVGPLRIGALSGAGAFFADMEFFAAAIWRRALSAAELAAVATYWGVS